MPSSHMPSVLDREQYTYLLNKVYKNNNIETRKEKTLQQEKAM